jgi:drug/metabolite transporter (DMT)-like permease
MEPAATSTRSGFSRKADLALLLMTAIWGVTFPVVKTSLEDASPFVFLLLRFGVAVLVLFLVARSRLRKFNRAVLIPGGLLGVVFFLGFSFQTMGLGITTASRSAFITGLSVVFVPFISARLEKRSIGLASYLGVLLAVCGLWLITNPGTEASFNRGDFLTLLCAFSFAFQIVLVQLYTRYHDYVHLLLLQFLVTILLSVPGALLLESAHLHVTSRLVTSVLFTAIVATVIAIGIQFRYQKLTTATRAAIIYTLEPVFAAFFAYLLLREMIHGRGWIGAGLILLAIALAEIGRKQHVVTPP